MAVFNDTFTRADELLDADAAWTKIGGAGGSELAIVSNQLALSGAAGGRRAYMYLDQSDPEMVVEAEVPSVALRSGNTNTQLILRAVDGENYIGIGVSQLNNVAVGIRVAGTWTEWATTGQLGVDVVALKLAASGTNIVASYDVGAGWVDFHTQPSVTTFATETLGGFISNLNAPGTVVWDNFTLTIPEVTDAFSDDFNRADELLDADADWTKIGGAGGSELAIVSNQLALSGAAGSRRAYTCTDQGDADMIVTATVPNLVDRGNSTNTQIAIRVLDASNYIGLGVSQSNACAVGIRIAGVWTEWATTTTQPTDIIAVKLEASATTITASYDRGAGWVVFHTESPVSTFGSETLGGFVSNYNNPGIVVWDNFTLTPSTAVSLFGYQIVEEIFHYDDPGYAFTYGNFYYFNPGRSGTSNGTGTSDANAFYTSAQINAKTFAQGDKLLFRTGTQYTIPSHANRIRNTSMRGNNADQFFYIGAYHMVGGVETPGLGGQARPIIQGVNPAIYDPYGAMSEAEAQTFVPIPAISGGLIQDGSQEGLLNFYGQSIAHMRCGDLHVRYSGGRCVRMSSGASPVNGGFLMQNMFMEGSFKQNLHVGGYYDVIVEDCFFTISELETIYGANPGNTQAHTASKGTEGDPNTPMNHTWRGNCVWDSLGAEAMSSNSGFRTSYFLDNVMIDSGSVLGHYIDRTHDTTIMRNILIRTARPLFQAFDGPTVNGRDGFGFMCQNEVSSGSFPWNIYNTAADFEEYQTQRALIAFNIVCGVQENFGIVSQASVSGSAQVAHRGEPHSGGVYLYCNLSLDPSDVHIGVPTSTYDYVLRTDIPPRVWGNVFYTSPTGAMASLTEICDSNIADFASVVTNNYRSSNVTTKTNFDQNETTSGLTMPLSDYFDLSTYMTFDADGHMTYDDVRDFLEWMGINPDNLAEKNLSRFKPTANVSSGLAASALTTPPLNTWGDTLTDIEGMALPSTVYFGPFAGIAGAGGTVLITSAEGDVFTNGETITIIGSGFGATKGSGSVVISPTDNIADGSAVTQTTTAWSNTSINITASIGALDYNTPLYLFVENDSDVSNAAGRAVQFAPIVTVTHTLYDEFGAVVASETGIKVSIWRNREPTGAPDEEQTAQATNGAGSITLAISGEGLDPGDPIYLMLHKDHATTWQAGIVKVVPTYS